MINRELLTKIEFKKPYAFLATWFGCGLLAPAPGTWGTLGAMPFAILIWLAGGWPALLAGVIAVSLIGYRAAGEFEKATGQHDAGAVVIDEVAGIWLTLVVSTFSPFSLVTGFLLFRLFDILKPWPVSWFDSLPGAKGVMADDLAAGIYAAICLWGIHYATGFG